MVNNAAECVEISKIYTLENSFIWLSKGTYFPKKFVTGLHMAQQGLYTPNLLPMCNIHISNMKTMAAMESLTSYF